MDDEKGHGPREFVGARIRRLREARGLSVRDLSDRSDVPDFTIGAIERGKKITRLEYLEDLARALGVPLVEFFGDEEGDG